MPFAVCRPKGAVYCRSESSVSSVVKLFPMIRLRPVKTIIVNRNQYQIGLDFPRDARYNW